MEANELMIGDWLLYKNEPIRVLDINVMSNSTPNTITTRFKGSNCAVYLYIEPLSPIPVTSEILENNCNAAHLDDGNGGIIPNVWHFATNCNIVFYGERCGFWYTKSLEDGDELFQIKYVHELQHLFKLCGIKKEISL